MSIPDLSHDGSIFPDSHAFVPERWLAAPQNPPLERYMVSFGRGTRACLGIKYVSPYSSFPSSPPYSLLILSFLADARKHSLAWTELYLTLGMLFRRYKFELLEPDVRDVQMAHDFFIPVTRLEGKGVRVWVQGVRD